jgi:SNF2 family DNA or RNA helicase
MAKAKYAVEWVSDFMDSNDESIAVAIHHENVREMLFNIFRDKGYNPLSLTGKDDAWAKQRIASQFNSGSNRILVINSIAGGEGLNLQSCANALVLERQWNSANEEQFEGRFHRNGQKQGVTVTYLIAKGTIDEFFHEKVFEKKNILASVGIGEASEDSSSLDSLKEFAEFVASGRI